MKKFFLTILFLIFVIIGGLVFFTIRSFNTDTFQKQIIQNITEMTGREFTVIGTTTVSWFPAPQIVMNDVTLANTKGANRAVMLRANKILVELDWATLLKSPLVIKKIDIENPTLFLERTSPANVNWNFPFLFDSMNDLDDLSHKSDKIQTRVDKLIIRNGSIDYVNEVSQTKLLINNINGNLNIETLQGPYTFSGTFTAKEKSMTAQLKVMQIRNEAPVPFTLNIIGENDNFSMDFNGSITPNSKSSLQMKAEGSFSVRSPNEFLAVLGFNPLSKQLDIPSVGNLTYESSNGIDAFKSFTIRFGDQDDAVALTGSIGREKGKKQQYNATIAINKFDYAQWKDFLSDMNWTSLTNEKTPNFDLKLNIQDFIYNQMNIKNMTAEFSKKDNRFQIQGGKAVLDGKTNITFDGGSITQDKKNGVSFMFVGNSENINELLSKFVDTKSINQKVLGKTSFKGGITIYPDEYHLDFQEVLLNKTKLTGTTIYTKTTEKPLINTNLKIKNFNFDEFIPFQKTETKTNIFKLPVLAKQDVRKLAILQKITGPFNLSFENIVFRGVPAEKLNLSGEITNDYLKVEKFSATNMANAKLEGSALFTEPTKDNISIANMNIKFSTAHLDLFLDKANLMTDNRILKKAGKFSTDMTLSQDKNIWTITANNKIKDLTLNLSGKLNTGEDELVFNDMSLEMKHPDFKVYSKEFINLNGHRVGLSGEFAVKLLVSGTEQNFKIASGNIRVGSEEVNISGSYEAGKPSKVTLIVEANKINAQKYMWRDFANFQFTGPGATQSFDHNGLNDKIHIIELKSPQLNYHNHQLNNATLKWHLNGPEKTLTINELSGTIGPELAKFMASATITWKDKHQVSLEVSTENLAIPNNLFVSKNMTYGEGTASYKMKLQSQGITPLEILKNLKGNGTATLKNNVWVGTSIDKITPFIERSLSNRVPKNIFDKEMNRILNSGKTDIEKVEIPFNIENGVMKALNTQLTGNSFTANPMSIEWDIPRNTYNIDVPLTLTAYTDLPPFALSVKGQRKNLTYKTNFIDLSDSVANIVNEDNSRIAKIEQDEQNKKEATARNEREDKIKQAILEAREAVQQADIKVKPGDNQKAHYLIQNAQDALSFVNNMSVKVTLTDAEYIQLMEQSRLAVMYAEEAVAEATNDKFFEERKQLRAFADSAYNMQKEIERIQNKHPEVEIVQKLSPTSKEYERTLKNLADTAHPHETDEEHQIQMYTARTTYTKLVKTYQYILRFDAVAKELQPVPTTVPKNTKPEIFEKVDEQEETFSDTNEVPEFGQSDVVEEKFVQPEAEHNQWEYIDATESNIETARSRIRNKISRSVADDNSEENIYAKALRDTPASSEIELPIALPSKASSLRGTIKRAE